MYFEHGCTVSGDGPRGCSNSETRFKKFLKIGVMLSCSSWKLILSLLLYISYYLKSFKVILGHIWGHFKSFENRWRVVRGRLEFDWRSIWGHLEVDSGSIRIDWGSIRDQFGIHSKSVRGCVADIIKPGSIQDDILNVNLCDILKRHQWWVWNDSFKEW